MNVKQSIQHILIVEDRQGRRLLRLDKQTYSLGRKSNNDIKLNDKFVSRHHATLLRIKGVSDSNHYSYRLIDGDLQGNSSTNGLMVNGYNCLEHDLQHGDVISFGSDAKISYYLYADSGEIPLEDSELVNQTHSEDWKQELLPVGELTDVKLPFSPETENLTVFAAKPALKQKSQSLLGQRTRAILGLLLLAAGAAWGGNWWFSSRSSQNPAASGSQPQGVPVKVSPVKEAIVADSSEVVGTLESRRSLMLKPAIDGRISQILVKEGDRVRAGQIILRLDSADWEAELLQAKAKLENAKAGLAELQAGNRAEDIDEAKAQLREAQARLANAQGGARPEEIAQAQAQLDSAQAKADLAQQKVERYRSLSLEGAISADQFQEYLTEERSANASVAQAKRRLAELNESRRSDIAELEAALEQTKQNLRRLENGPRLENIAQAKAEVAQAAAQVRMAEVKFQKTNIVAPIAGTIGDIPIKLGEYVSEGDVLTAITANETLELNLSIPLEKTAQLRLGLPVEILAGQGAAIATGKISFISPEVNANSQLILAKAAFSNVGGELLNRQFIQARVIWGQRPGILVPAAAISRLGGQTFVFVVQTEESSPGVVKQKRVKLGNLQGNDYQVLEGLQPGEKIVTAGILNLRDGVPIQVLPD